MTNVFRKCELALAYSQYPWPDCGDGRGVCGSLCESTSIKQGTLICQLILEGHVSELQKSVLLHFLHKSAVEKKHTSLSKQNNLKSILPSTPSTDNY